jgi:hypothetical protein
VRTDFVYRKRRSEDEGSEPKKLSWVGVPEKIFYDSGSKHTKNVVQIFPFFQQAKYRNRGRNSKKFYSL